MRPASKKKRTILTSQPTQFSKSVFQLSNSRRLKSTTKCTNRPLNKAKRHLTPKCDMLTKTKKKRKKKSISLHCLREMAVG